MVEEYLRRLIPTTEDIPLGITAVGLASADAIGEKIREFWKDAKPEWAKTIGGWLIYKLGGIWHPYIASFGAGVLLSGLSDWVTKAGWYWKGGSSPSPQKSGSPQVHTLESLAQAQAMMG